MRVADDSLRPARRGTPDRANPARPDPRPGSATRPEALRRIEDGGPTPVSSAKRPTIADIARQAGVTKAAVSFAPNGQPGVSDQTRTRVLDIARKIGWQPNSAARALSDGRAGAFGLVVDRPAATLGVEPFFMQLISGIQAELSANHIPLLFTIARDQDAEIELYRSWWAQRRVDGVFVVDLRVTDRRIAVLEELGMPAVVIGHPAGAGSLPAMHPALTALHRDVTGYGAHAARRLLAAARGERSGDVKDAAHELIRRESNGPVPASPAGHDPGPRKRSERGSRTA
jgi:DNA-binding LacI/PurR family transcriptional regulator